MAHALIVDDSSSTVQGLKSLCELEGFTTSTALSIDEARLELCRRHPSVALLDLNLPDGNGLGLVDSIRTRCDAVVVLITGHASPDMEADALRLQVSDYLTKPVDVGRLQAILRAVHDSRPPGVTLERPAVPSTSAHRGRFSGLLGQ
jgi:two-component system repressor protein LuxO